MSRLATCALLVVLGCSGSDDDDTNIALADAPMRHAAALCERLFSCCDAGELAAKLAVLGTPAPTTEAQCATAYAAGLQATYDQMAGDVRLVYSPSEMGRCVRAIAATACSALELPGDEPFLRDCAQVFDGKIALGQPCQLPSDCRGAAVCSGVCEARAQEGESCINVGCDLALFCDTTRTCRPTKADGESCQFGTDCQSTVCDGSKCIDGTPQVCDGV